MYLMLASCSADEPVAQNTTDGVIRYTVATANQSRAAHSYCANNKPEMFKVWATTNPGNITYIDGDDIKMGPDGDYTDDSGIRYWPKDASLSFYAVVDDVVDKKSTFNFTTKKVVGYEVDTDISKQLDLMYAVVIGIDNDDTNQGKVQLNFRHALSQICFKARNENPKSVITINSITLKDIVSTGDYTLPSASTTAQISDHGTSATIDASSRGSWSLGTSKSDYSVTIADGKINGNGYKYLDVNLSEDNNHTSSDWYDKVLNLIPQERNDVTFTLNITVENLNGDGTTSSVENGTDDPAFDVNVHVDISWKEGNRYIYAFNFPKDWKPDGLNAIEYKVSIDDFNEEDPYIVVGVHDAVLMRESPALYFATTNIGASSPEKTGLYFWWGDIEGHTVGDGFDFGTAETEGKSLTWLYNNGYMTEDNDNTGHLTTKKDAATKYWGVDWRMPTKAELEWLANGDNCYWHQEKDESDKTIGYTVVSKTTGGSIYLPAAGYIEGTEHKGDGVSYYWSSQPEDFLENYGGKNWTDDRAWRLKAEGSNHAVHNIGNRTDGFPIRPVSNGATITPTPSK